MILQLFRSKIFLIGLGIKILCLFLFPTFFPRELFIPFFDQAVLNAGENPWSLSPASYFPYGGVLFTVLAIPKFIFYWIFGESALGPGFLGLFSLKLPLLIFDVVLLQVLIGIIPDRKKSLLKYYWLNPVLFYISYVYGQLDVVSAAFLLLSLTFLIKGKITRSGMLLGLAIGCKFHVAFCIPFIMTYIWNRNYLKDSLTQLSRWFSGATLTAGVAFIPVFLAHRGSYNTLGSPEVKRLFAMQLSLTEGTTLYLGIIILLAVLGRLLISTRITELGLIYGTGFLMGSLLLATHAAPGWFYWFLPFLCLFFSMYLNVPPLIFWALQLLYFGAFLGVDAYLGEIIPDIALENILYSGLHATLLANMIALWFIALAREVIVKKRESSFKIGIAGDSGSGKSVLTDVMLKLFGKNTSVVIEGDNYHKWERGDVGWKTFTHLNPLANELFSLNSHIKAMNWGRPISQPLYNHDSGKFTLPMEFTPARSLIVQGLHTFHYESTRKLFDLKIFLAPEESLRTFWKIQRDVNERHASVEKVLKQDELRREDAQTYITPQAQFADIIIQCKPGNSLSEVSQESSNPELYAHWILKNDIDLTDLCSGLTSGGIEAVVTLRPEWGDRIDLMVKGKPTAELIEVMANSLFPSIRHLTRGMLAPTWCDGINGVTQLVVLLLIRHSQNQELL